MKINSVANVKDIFKILNKSLLKNFYLIIILLLLPLISLLISYFSSKNIIIFIQGIPMSICIDVFFIGFIIIPFYVKTFRKSLIFTFSSNKKKIFKNIYLVTIIYFTFITLMTIIYAFILISLFGISHIKNDIYRVSDNQLIHCYNDIIFSNDKFSSSEFAIENYQRAIWWQFLLWLFFSYIYYIAAGSIIDLLTNDFSLFCSIIIPVSLISLVNGGMVIPIETITQYLPYVILSAFTINIYPMIFISGTWLGSDLFNEIPMVYSSTDFDFRYPLTNNYFIWIGIVFILLVVILSVAIFVFKQNGTKTSVIFKKINKKKLFFNFLEYNFKFNTSYLQTKNHKTNEQKSIEWLEHTCIIINKKSYRKNINNFKKNYNFISVEYFNLVTNYGYGVFVDGNTLFGQELPFEEIKNSIINNIENKMYYEVLGCYNVLISIYKKIQENKKTPHEYFFLISFLLNSNINYIILELTPFINSREMFEYLLNYATFKNKTIVTLGSSKKPEEFNFSQIIKLK